MRAARPILGQERIEPLIQAWARDQVARLADALAPCGSPIETAFAVALLASGDDEGAFLELTPAKPTSKRPHPFATGRAGDLFAQYPTKIDGRAILIDFALVTPSRKLAIELDGHDYHATKPAMEADKSRDRALTAIGWTPIRFTGTEVYRDASKCAAQALELIGAKAAHLAPPARVVHARHDALALRPVRAAEPIEENRTGAAAVLAALLGEGGPSVSRLALGRPK